MTRPFVAAVRHPAGWLRDVCGGESAFPLVVLFGLNAVDELDRTAFGILLPNIRDEFGLDNTGVDAPSSWYRKQLVDEMSKAGVEKPEKFLTNHQVSMVIVRLTIPVGSRQVAG